MRLHETVKALADAERDFAQAQAAAELAVAWTATANRKRDARRKIVVGALVLHAIDNDPELGQKVARLVRRASPRDADLLKETLAVYGVPEVDSDFTALNTKGDGSEPVAGKGEAIEGEAGELPEMVSRLRDIEAALSSSLAAIGGSSFADGPLPKLEGSLTDAASSGVAAELFGDTAFV
jgi:hypothetical protein